MTSNTATAIYASDFHYVTCSVTPDARNRWGSGAMRHVVAALQGAEVTVIAENRTGFCLTGVQLVGVIEGGGGRDARVKIKSTYSDGTTHVTNYRLTDIGTIIVSDQGGVQGAKHTAIRSYMDEVSTATEIAREVADAQGAVTGWGKWAGRAMAHGVSVTYEPSKGNDFYADKWGKFWHTTVELGAIVSRQQANAAAKAAN